MNHQPGLMHQHRPLLRYCCATSLGRVASADVVIDV